MFYELRLIWLVVIMFAVNVNAISQVEISGVAVNIGTDVSVHIESDVDLSSDVDWVNNGNFWIYCNQDTELSCNVREDSRSTGCWRLVGSMGLSVYSELSDLNINNLVVDCANLNLESNLSVNNLSFDRGIIDVISGNLLTVNNSSENSLKYTINSASYIKGYLKRRVKPGCSYLYPVGGNRGLCYAKIDNVESDRDVSISYVPLNSDDSFLNPDIYSQVADGSWDILCDNDDESSFGLCFDIENLLNNSSHGTFKIVGAKSSLLNGDVYSLETEMYFPRVQTEKGKYNFRYVLAEEVDFEIVNLIVANGKGGGFFKLPDVSSIEWGEFALIDSQGKLVYHSDKYANELTVSGFREGVYFYKLSYTRGTGEIKTINNFIEVVYEK